MKIKLFANLKNKHMNYGSREVEITRNDNTITICGDDYSFEFNKKELVKAIKVFEES